MNDTIVKFGFESAAVWLRSALQLADEFGEVGRWTPVVRMARDLLREIEAVSVRADQQQAGDDSPTCDH